MGYHRKAEQKGTQFLFVSANLSSLKRVPHNGTKEYSSLQ
jgi:hypothetical protein